MTKEAGPATPRTDELWERTGFGARIDSAATLMQHACTLERELLAAEERAATDHKNLIDMLALEVELRRQAERRAAELEAGMHEWVVANAPGGWINDLRERAAQGARDAERFRLWKEHCSAEPTIPLGHFKVSIVLPTNAQERMGPAIDALSASKGGGVGE